VRQAVRRDRGLAHDRGLIRLSRAFSGLRFNFKQVPISGTDG